jgi:hypothetical protein
MGKDDGVGITSVYVDSFRKTKGRRMRCRLAAACHSEIRTVRAGMHGMDGAQANIAALGEREVGSVLDRHAAGGVGAASKRPAHAVAIGKCDEEM